MKFLTNFFFHTLFIKVSSFFYKIFLFHFFFINFTKFRLIFSIITSPSMDFVLKYTLYDAKETGNCIEKIKKCIKSRKIYSKIKY